MQDEKEGRAEHKGEAETWRSSLTNENENEDEKENECSGGAKDSADRKSFSFLLIVLVPSRRLRV